MVSNPRGRRIGELVDSAHRRPGREGPEVAGSVVRAAERDLDSGLEVVGRPRVHLCGRPVPAPTRAFLATLTPCTLALSLRTRSSSIVSISTIVPGLPARTVSSSSTSIVWPPARARVSSRPTRRRRMRSVPVTSSFRSSSTANTDEPLSRDHLKVGPVPLALWISTR